MLLDKFSDSKLIVFYPKFKNHFSFLLSNNHSNLSVYRQKGPL